MCYDIYMRERGKGEFLMGSCGAMRGIGKIWRNTMGELRPPGGFRYFLFRDVSGNGKKKKKKRERKMLHVAMIGCLV